MEPVVCLASTMNSSIWSTVKAAGSNYEHRLMNSLLKAATMSSWISSSICFCTAKRGNLDASIMHRGTRQAASTSASFTIQSSYDKFIACQTYLILKTS